MKIARGFFTFQKLWRAFAVALFALSPMAFASPPLIVSSPHSVAAWRADTVRFEVSASGLEPLTYQWFKGTNAITNATNSSLTLTNIRITDAGQYHVTVTDVLAASADSSSATLTVIDPTSVNVTFTPIEQGNIFSAGSNPQGTNTLLIGTQGNGTVTRGLLRFDLTSIRREAQITSARLQMTVVQNPLNPAPNTSVLFHRASRPWTAAATWASPFAGPPWATPGGLIGTDFATTASAGTVIGDVASYNFGPTAALAADVQAWVTNSALNFGWFVKSDSESTPNSARHFGPRGSVYAPQLTLGYTLPSVAPIMTNIVLQQSALTFRITPTAGRLYKIETRGAVDAGEWFPQTNAPSGNGQSPIQISIPISPTNQFFRLTVE